MLSVISKSGYFLQLVSFEGANPKNLWLGFGFKRSWVMRQLLSEKLWILFLNVQAQYSKYRLRVRKVLDRLRTASDATRNTQPSVLRTWRKCGEKRKWRREGFWRSEDLRTFQNYLKRNTNVQQLLLCMCSRFFWTTGIRVRDVPLCGVPFVCDHQTGLKLLDNLSDRFSDAIISLLNFL